MTRCVAMQFKKSAHLTSSNSINAQPKKISNSLPKRQSCDPQAYLPSIRDLDEVSTSNSNRMQRSSSNERRTEVDDCRHWLDGWSWHLVDLLELSLSIWCYIHARPPPRRPRRRPAFKNPWNCSISTCCSTSLTYAMMSQFLFWLWFVLLSVLINLRSVSL